MEDNLNKDVRMADVIRIWFARQQDSWEICCIEYEQKSGEPQDLTAAPKIPRDGWPCWDL